MENEINELLMAIGDDYFNFSLRGEYHNPDKIEEFRKTLSVLEGSKYLKIIKKMGNQECVWGFVVKKDDKKFRAGDILKAASWASPARNQARGNILDGGYQIRWTGPEYL